MTGEIVVAVIALFGVLAPVYFGTSAAGRDRAAMKGLADLVEALPSDSAQRAPLLTHLDATIEEYLSREQAGSIHRARAWAFFWYAVTFAASAGFALFGVTFKPPRTDTQVLVLSVLGVFISGAGIATVLSLFRWRVAKYRRFGGHGLV